MTATVDWQAVEREYRAALLSNRELASKYGCSESAVRKKAKQKGWEKDLSAEIRKRVSAKVAKAAAEQTKLASNLADQVVAEVKAKHKAQEDERVIEDASNAITGIIAEHHEILGGVRDKIRRAFSLIGGQLAQAEQEQAGTEEQGQIAARVIRMMETHTKTLERVIKLERVSYGLEDGVSDPGTKPLDALLREALNDDES